VGSGARLAEVARSITRGDGGPAIVVDGDPAAGDDQVQGVLRMADVVTAASRPDGLSTTAGAVCRDGQALLTPDSTPAHALDVMRRCGVHRLPVVDHGHLLGVVDVADVLAASHTVTVTLRDGRAVHIRPVGHDDAAALREALQNADADTLYSRFLGPPPRLTDELIDRLLATGSHQLALVAVDFDGRGCAIARFEPTHDPTTAEIAIAVDPAWRRVGLGRILLQQLTAAATTRGVSRFVASYLAENHAVARLVASSGLPCRSCLSSGVMSVELDVSATPTKRETRSCK
jgi:CBS domain-containing protein